MSADYQAGYWVRRARLLGWLLSAGMALLLVLVLGWKIAGVSEQRAMQATREHLASSLSGLSAQWQAKDRVADAAWKRRNPFVLLRWRQDNYCGELAARETPHPGCWYWLPGPAWVLYRPRFADGWLGDAHEVRAWKLRAVPEALATATQTGRGAFALELEAVPALELAAQGL